MREPDFWWSDSALGALLSPLGALYGAITAARMRQDGAHATVPVICVGNLTLGGTGKTPTAIAIARHLVANGERPVMLTRGYGGRDAGPLLVDGHAGADAVGDEPLLLARAAPTVVARDRAAGAALAAAQNATVIVMDDGLQNPSLRKDLVIAVVDGRRGLGNGRVFPAGPLRAPLAAQIPFVSAVLIVGTPGPACEPMVAAARARDIPILNTTLTPDEDVIAALRGRPLLAFAGIGDPTKFAATLTNAGAPPQRLIAFADHHRFTERDADQLLALAKADALQLVTTEKDQARLAGATTPALARLAREAVALPVRLTVAEPDAVARLLRAALNR
ncbi:MAG: tetraacyldisaccharide 4'-kinase [Rhizobiales bacterium]|nr:tetraacyldisaccharide 4'-kinase [Hyphomicrobiales bacterium]OJY44820.1 MAG: tetraacyldisaccharide 4'-kinase [Rhizobiales bacterium 64-17]